MGKRRSVRVFRGPADATAAPNEIIMEFAAGKTAATHINGLVAFRLVEGDDRRLHIDVYAVDGPVAVTVASNVTVYGGPKHEPVRVLYAPEPKPQGAA